MLFNYKFFFKKIFGINFLYKKNFIIVVKYVIKCQLKNINAKKLTKCKNFYKIGEKNYKMQLKIINPQKNL